MVEYLNGGSTSVCEYNFEINVFCEIVNSLVIFCIHVGEFRNNAQIAGEFVISAAEIVW